MKTARPDKGRRVTRLTTVPVTCAPAASSVSVVAASAASAVADPSMARSVPDGELRALPDPHPIAIISSPAPTVGTHLDPVDLPVT
jgi:hypothetical protein